MRRFTFNGSKSFRIAFVMFLVAGLAMFKVTAQNCAVNAGVEQTVCENDQLFLYATTAGAFEDVPGEILWTQVSGPAVTIVDPTAYTTEVTGIVGGEYVFRLNAVCADGIYTYQDVVKYVSGMTPSNAGPDIILCPGTAFLSGNTPAADEEGFWSISSGNGGISIESGQENLPNAQINVSSTTGGQTVFVWRIQNPNRCYNLDTVVVTNIGGESPVVAGDDIVLDSCYTLTQSTNLSASYGGLGQEYGQYGKWTAVSGPNVPTIADVNDNNTTVSGLIEGSYTFRWDVIGGVTYCGVNGSAEVKITVKGATTTLTDGGGMITSHVFCEDRTSVILEGTPPENASEEVGWEIVDSSGVAGISINNVSNYIAEVTGLDPSKSEYKFRYNIINTATGCTGSTDVTVRFEHNHSIEFGNTFVALKCWETTAEIPYTDNGDGAVTWSIQDGPTTAEYNAIPTAEFLVQSSPAVVTGLFEPGTYLIRISKQPSVGQSCEATYDYVRVVVSYAGDLSNAGTDQVLPCTDSATAMAGNNPVDGIGEWSLISAPAGTTVVIDSINNYNSPVSGLTEDGVYEFKWKIVDGPFCYQDEDTALIVVSSVEPIAKVYGGDQDVCDGKVLQLNAEPAKDNETGTWAFLPLDAPLTFDDKNSPTAKVSGFIFNETYTLIWVVENACGFNADEIEVSASVATCAENADAGTDKCISGPVSSFNLEGNTVTDGDSQGTWTQTDGPFQLNFASGDEDASVTYSGGDIPHGVYTFVWSIEYNPLGTANDDVSSDEVTISISGDVGTLSRGGNQFIDTESTTMAAGANTLAQWIQLTGNGGATIVDPSAANTEITGLTDGVYQFGWSVEGGLCGDTMVIDTIYVSIAPEEADAGPDDNICILPSYVLNADSVADGLWQTISGPNSPSFSDPTKHNAVISGLIMGEYVLSWNSYGGPFAEPSSDIITLTYIPAADAGPDYEDCTSSSVVKLEGNIGSTGTWYYVSGGASAVTLVTTSNNTASVSGLEADEEYEFEYVIDEGGSCESRDIMAVKLNAPPTTATATADVEAYCGHTGPFNLIGSEALVGTGEWTLVASPAGGGFGNINANTTTFTPTTGNEYGVFVFQWAISNGACTQNSALVTVENYPTESEGLSADAGADQTGACDNAPIYLDANSLNNNYEFGQWTFVAGGTGTGTPTIVSKIDPTTEILGLEDKPGTYIFQWTVYNDCDTVTDQVIITVVDAEEPAKIVLETTEVCIGDNVTISTSPAGGTWSSLDDPTLAYLDVADETNVVFTNNATTSSDTVTYYYTVGGATACPTVDSVVVINHANPVANIGASSLEICELETIELTADAAQNGTGLWTLESAGTVNILSPNNPKTEVTGLSIGVPYTFRWTVSNGACTDASDDITVTINPKPESNNWDTTLCYSLTDDVLALDFSDAIESPAGAEEYIIVSTYSSEPSVIPTPIFTQDHKFDGSENLTYKNTTDSLLYVTYVVVPYSASDCEGDQFEVRVNVLPEPTFVHPDTIRACAGYLGYEFVDTLIGVNVYDWISNGTAIIDPTEGNFVTALETTLENTTEDTLSTTITVSPMLIYDGVLCNGVDTTIEIIVLPFADIDPIDDIEICNGDSIADITFNAIHTEGTTVTYNWEYEGDYIGLNNGSGNFIEAFEAINTDTLRKSATVSISPEYEIGDEGVCSQVVQEFKIQVNPTPFVLGDPEITICQGESVDFTPTSWVDGTTYTWEITNTIGTVLYADSSGTGAITEALSTSDLEYGQATYTIKPYGPVDTICSGPEFILKVNVIDCQPILGISNQTVSVTNNGDGTHNALFNIRVENFGNLLVEDIQVTQELDAIFGTGNYVVNEIFSTSFAVDTTYDGNANLNMLDGTAGNGLEPGASTNIELEIIILTEGSWNLSATVTGIASNGDALSDISQNGSNPDPNDNGDPTEASEQDPTPVSTSCVDATVAGGPDAAICAGDNYQIVGTTTTDVASFVWQTEGDGTFNDSTTTLNPIYYPGTADVLAENVKLFIDVNSLGTCAAVSDTFELSITSLQLVDTTVVDADCDSRENGSFAIEVTGGVEPYVYDLSIGESQILNEGVVANFATLATGGYIYTVTDSNGCSITGSFEIDDPEELKIIVTEENDVICNGAVDGSAVVRASGGNGTYIFDWGTGIIATTSYDSISTATNLVPGFYVVRATDPVSGCWIETSLEIEQPTPLSLTINIASPDCNNGGLVTLHAVGGTPSYSYSLLTGTGTLVGNTINGIAAGSMSVRVRDANGCEKDSLFTIIAGTCDPLAVNDNTVTPKDSTVTGNVLNNDTDPDEGTLTVTQFIVAGDTVDVDGGIFNSTIPDIGSITINPDGSYEFVPEQGYTGDVPEITYTASNGSGGDVDGELNITVLPGDSLVAVDDNIVSEEDSTATGDVTLNDIDPNGLPLTVTQFVIGGDTTIVEVGGSSYIILGVGEITMNPDGTYEFVPEPGYDGPVPDITYTVTNGTEIDEADLNITLLPNADLVAYNDNIISEEDSTITGNVTLNDVDPNGLPLTVTEIVIAGDTTAVVAGGTSIEIAGFGELTINPAGEYTFVPVPGYSGDVPEMVYTVTNGTEYDDAEINITIRGNDDLVAIDDNIISPEDSIATGNLTFNDIDPNGLPLTVTEFVVGGDTVDVSIGPGSSTIAGIGTITISPDGTYEFVPEPGYSGDVPEITYTVTNGTETDEADLNLTILPVNDIPIATADTSVVDEDSPVSGNLAINDTISGDGGNIWTIVNQPDSGTVIINNNGTYTYMPDPDFNGVDSFVYMLCDVSGTCDTAVVTVTVNAVNDPPIVVDDEMETPEDTPVVYNIVDNDFDIDGNIDPGTIDLDPTTLGIDITYTVIGEGVYEVDPGTGELTFTPDSNFYGETTPLTYQVCDDGTPLPAECGTADIIVTVTPVNDPPIAGVDTMLMQLNPGGTNTVTVLANEFSGTDVDGTISFVRITDMPAGATSITVDGVVYASIPTGGIDVATTPEGQPLFDIEVDPMDGVSAVNLEYFVVDNEGAVSLIAGSVNIPFESISVAGNVFADSDGLTNNIVDGTGTNGGSLYMNLVNMMNEVVGSVAVAADGSYSFTEVDGLTANETFNLILSEGAQTIGSTLTEATYPDVLHSVGENIGSGAGDDGMVDGILTVNTNNGSLVDLNFGVAEVMILAEAIVTDANCDSNEDGAVQLGVISGNIGAVTYELSIGESNETGLFENLAAGGYIFTVSDEDGNEASGSFFVDDPNELELTLLEENDNICFNANNGSARVFASGGTLPYTFDWNGVNVPAIDDSISVYENIPSGIYVVTVTDALGCKEIETLEIEQPDSLDIQMVDLILPDCDDAGELIVTGTGGVAPYTYTTSQGTVDRNQITGISSGIVTVIITDANNCENSIDVIIINKDITSPEIKECAAVVAQSIDAGMCTADITLVPPMVFDNCDGTDIRMEYHIIAPDNSVSSLMDTSSQVNYVFMVGTSRVIWTITDRTGNISTCTQMVTISETEDPVVSCPETTDFVFDANPAICGVVINNTDLDASASDNCGTYTMSHNYGDWALQNTLEGAFFPVGLTEITWLATDLSGNTDSCTITITVNDAEIPEFFNCPTDVTYTVGLFADACESGSIWSIPVAGDNCSQVSVTQIDGPAQGEILPVGLYPITYQAEDAAGNITTCSFAINVVDTEDPVIVCAGNDIVVESDLGQCTWASPRRSLTPLLANSNCPSEVTWRVQNPDGSQRVGRNDVSGYEFQLGESEVFYHITEIASGQDWECSFSVTVEDAEAPVINCQPTLEITAAAGECSSIVDMVPPVSSDNCSANLVSFFRVFGPDNSTGDLIEAANSTFEFNNGISRVEWTVVDESGNEAKCWQDVWISPDVDALIPEAGENTSICETDDVFVTAASAPTYANVMWTSSGTGSFEDPTQVNTNYTPSANDIDDGFVVLTITSSSDCASTSDQMLLRISAPPLVAAGDDGRICENTDYQLRGTLINNASAVAWSSLGTGTFSDRNVFNPVYTPSQADIEAGKVDLVFRGISGSTCEDELDTLTLFIDRLPIVAAGDDAWICEAETFALESASLQFSGQVKWTTNGSGTFDDKTVVNAVYTPSSADVMNGSVILTISVTSDGMCEVVSDELSLKISPAATIDAGENRKTCFNEQLQITGATATNYETLVWTTTGAGTLENAESLTPSYTPADDEAGVVTFTLSITSAPGCKSLTLTDNVQVEILPPLIVDVGDDVTVYTTTSTVLSAEVFNGSESYFYSWQPASSVKDPNSNNTETVELLGSTTFEVTVIDANSGCIASDALTVIVEDEADDVVSFYRGFSPNNDGVNDTWSIKGIDKFPLNKVMIFNRWGDKVREMFNYNNTSVAWDGTNDKGEDLPDGTYFYVVELRNVEEFTGWVHIRTDR